MAQFPTTRVQGSPTGLVVYKLVAMTEIDWIVSDGFVRCQNTGPDSWKIGLRETIDDAVDRTNKISGHCNKGTHGVLRITFTPYGLAHYSNKCAGPNYRFRTMLQKVWYNTDKDWKAWHFHGDLPLQAEDEHGNLLITTVSIRFW